MSEPAGTGAAEPSVAGISHIGLSVADLEAAVEFWTRVMGFRVTTRLPTLCFVVDVAARVGIGLTDHGGDVRGAFDERHTGLDHLALAVPDTAALQAWAARLDELAIPNSGVVETEAGWHLNLRAPDHFPLELFVIAPAAAEAFGLASPEEAVAGSQLRPGS
jgi:glyoxylase I family protein